jgi:hypothetical protein
VSKIISNIREKDRGRKAWKIKIDYLIIPR